MQAMHGGGGASEMSERGPLLKIAERMGLGIGKIIVEQAKWSERDLSGPRGKELQRDVLAYIDWGLSVLDGRPYDFAEGVRLHENVKRWKPEDFPQRKAT